MKATLMAGGLAAMTCAASAWASQYSDAVLASSPNEYLRLDDTAGIGVDSSAQALHPLQTVEAGVTRGVAGPRSSDGFVGMGAANLAYSFPNNGPPNYLSAGAQTDSNLPATPQPGDGYIPATGAAPRTVVAWFRLTQRPGIEGDPNNDPNGRGGPIGFAQYGRATSGSSQGTEFRLGVACEQNTSGAQTGRDFFDINLGGRHVQATDTPIAQQTWYMAAVVCPSGIATAGAMRVFVDGQLQTLKGDLLQTVNTASGTAPDSFRIGRDFGGYGIGGQVDEVAVWQRALSDSDILNLYNAALGVVSISSTWNVDSNGNWSAGGSWLGGVPNGAGASVQFGSAITSARIITLDAPQTVGQMKFDNQNVSYTIAGTSANVLTIDNGPNDGIINNATGSHTIAARVVLNSTVDVTVAQARDILTMSGGLTGAATTGLNKLGPGTLELKNIVAGSLAVNAGTIHILSDGTSAGASKVASLSISGMTNAWASTLDLDTNYLAVTYSGASPISMIANQIKSGRAGGAWTGMGITSSTAAAIAALPHFPNKTALGFGDASALGITQFGGQGLGGNAVVIRYTITGDANLDGSVDSSDFTRLASHFNSAGAYWYDGDFNYDGVVNALDFNVLALNFGLSLPAPALGSPVPEPIGLLGFSLAVLSISRRRSR